MEEHQVDVLIHAKVIMLVGLGLQEVVVEAPLIVPER
jgi:hypothetical protein